MPGRVPAHSGDQTLYLQAHSLNKRPPIVSRPCQRSTLQTAALEGNVFSHFPPVFPIEDTRFCIRFFFVFFTLFKARKREDASLFLY